jgi:hypothetical protein
MAPQTDIIQQFSGGVSESEALGPIHSFKFAKHLNIYEDPSYVTFHNKTTKVSGSTVVDLVHWAVDASPFATDRFFYGDAGKFYKETSGGTWSVVSTISSSSGNGMAMIDDYVYLSKDAGLDRYGPLSGTPSLDGDYTEDDTINQMESVTGTGNSYTTPTSISEAATARQTMTKASNKDPLKEIDITLNATGTGDVTLTVHDSQNVSIGSKQIVNASLSVGSNTFTFSTPLRLDPDETYHFHVISTVADATVDTGTASDLEAAQFISYWSALISDTEFHPIIEHIGKVVIGNDRWLASQDGTAITTYDPNRVALAQGFKVRALAKDNEFVVAACYRGASVDEAEEARLFWWDGTSINFNFSRKMDAGLIHCLHTDSKGRLVAVVGNRGTIYIGSGGTEFTKIQDAPQLARQKKVLLLPGGVTEYQNRTHIGYAAPTSDSSFVNGVYEFGQGSGRLPETLNFAYTISTGTETDTDMKVSMVKGFGDDLYIGWLDGDGSTYGVDKVNIGDNPAVSGTYESLIISNGNPAKDKVLKSIIVTHEALGANDSVTIKYKLDRASSFTTGSANTTDNSTETELPVNKRYKELEVGFNLATTATFPKITSIVVLWDDLRVERNEP